jgi:hypothetical protein
MRYVPVILSGLAIGALLMVAGLCVYAKYHGGSADPRCVFGLRGYVEVRMLENAPVQDQVFCRYRPDVWQTP